MKVADALTEFRDHLTNRRLDVDGLDASSAVDAMLGFYVDVRADDVNLDDDGDMLLFQWGIYDWGDGPSFQYDITRQLITESPHQGDDDAFWQLSLMLHFPAEPATRALGGGERWCSRPADTAAFRTFIGDGEVAAAVRGHRPMRVELRFGPAG